MESTGGDLGAIDAFEKNAPGNTQGQGAHRYALVLFLARLLPLFWVICESGSCLVAICHPSEYFGFPREPHDTTFFDACARIWGGGHAWLRPPNAREITAGYQKREPRKNVANLVLPPWPFRYPTFGGSQLGKLLSSWSLGTSTCGQGQGVQAAVRRIAVMRLRIV